MRLLVSEQVHPIGNPGRARADMGGKPGMCPPPSPRLAPLYRRLATTVAHVYYTSVFVITATAGGSLLCTLESRAIMPVANMIWVLYTWDGLI